mmetsp:Transcript_5652/g.5820  ORF Transcript_5652/g.5820 Transcript_5652/m.5820 type:complete len:750 (-) Transcript_5652:169-2418(-)
MLTTESTTTIIVSCGAIALIWAFLQFTFIANTKLSAYDVPDEKSSLTATQRTVEQQTIKLKEVYTAISEGAEAFLRAEYSVCSIFVVAFAILVFSLIAWGQNVSEAFLTTLSFVLGAVTSILSGYIGMKVAVFSNVRTTINAQRDGYEHCFNTAFRAGSVMGFALNGLGLLVLYITLCIYRSQYKQDNWDILMECISGYGLGGSTIAMFGRVGGGIYTKAADVGADLVGKVVHGIPEDDPRNPATIADNVGDNVGDVAGMGADLFGSFAEATCACLVIGSQCQDLRESGWGAIMFPLIVSTFGLVVCFVTSFVATHIYPVTTEHKVELALRLQLILSTVLMIPATVISIQWLPSDFTIDGVAKTFTATRWDAYVCVILGVVGGLIIGLITEYYTSKEYQPVKLLANSCKTGAATNIIYGLALGYKSVIVPVFVLASIVYVSFALCDLYGIALAAVGMLGNLATGLTIDAYGPVCDNAGGIAEMAGLHSSVRKKTDALDAAGNTTAAVGKGFAIGSAALVSLALFGAFVTRLDHAEEENGGKTSPNVREILTPVIFAFLLIGAMIPYWFSALTMKSVGNAAMLMVEEVERQFKANPNLLVEGSTDRPDYKKCVEISTQASLKEMIAPGALVILTPLITGTFFGTNAVCAVLTGSLLSSVMLAISMSNTGGAWDNAKKYIELNPTAEYGAKGGDCHKAAVVGDTVGDPLKDTSGPALNIVMKLMAIISLVFANYFYQINDGHGLFGVPNDR